MASTARNGLKPLTNLQLEALKPADIGKRIREPGGLIGEVRANTHTKNNVSVTFAYRFRWQGTAREFHCGTWPADSLSNIRRARNKARTLLDESIDPIEQKKAQLQIQEATKRDRLAAIEREKAESLTLSALFEEWLPNTDRKDKGAELRRSFLRDVLPKLGEREIRLLTEKDFRSVLDTVVKRGANRMAAMLLADLKQMFRWAEKRKPWKKLIEDNPVEHLEANKITADDYDGSERTRTLSIAEIKELAERLPAAGLLKRTELCMWIMLATCCRIGEIVRARWEHIDLESDDPTWLIPKENAKNKVAHTVYLSHFVLPYFRQLRKLSGESAWCFPIGDEHDTTHVCIKSTTKQVRDRQMSAMNRKPMSNRSKRADALVLSGGDWVPHDLRRTGATLMQTLGITPETIERVLNHVEPNKLKRTYQTHDYAPEKRNAWHLLGERLSLILYGFDNVIILENAA